VEVRVPAVARPETDAPTTGRGTRDVADNDRTGSGRSRSGGRVCGVGRLRLRLLAGWAAEMQRPSLNFLGRLAAPSRCALGMRRLSSPESLTAVGGSTSPPFPHPTPPLLHANSSDRSAEVPFSGRRRPRFGRRRHHDRGAPISRGDGEAQRAAEQQWRLRRPRSLRRQTEGGSLVRRSAAAVAAARRSGTSGRQWRVYQRWEAKTLPRS